MWARLKLIGPADQMYHVYSLQSSEDCVEVVLCLNESQHQYARKHLITSDDDRVKFLVHLFGAGYNGIPTWDEATYTNVRSYAKVEMSEAAATIVNATTVARRALGMMSVKFAW